MWHCLTHYDEIARFRVKNLLVNDPEAVLAVMCFPSDLKSAEPRHAATPPTNSLLRRGRQVKCAAGGGGDGDGGRVGGSLSLCLVIADPFVLEIQTCRMSQFHCA